MNKYQKQAIVDLTKVAGAGLAVILVIGAIIRAGMEASDLVGALGMVAMGYAIYQLYLIRVGQLESEDRLNEMEQKYK
jgi:uncharacterized membrane protein